MSKKWIRIYLVSGTRIPKWIRNQTLNVVVERRRISGKWIRILSIRGAEAGFIGGGHVDVKMPGSDEFWVVFEPFRVLKITDHKGNPTRINHHFCERCFANTGKATGVLKPTELNGKFDMEFQCSVCDHQWTYRV